MDQDTYTTHIEDSPLQARGPYRNHTTDLPLAEAGRPQVIKASERILSGKSELHGESIIIEEKLLSHYLVAISQESKVG